MTSSSVAVQWAQGSWKICAEQIAVTARHPTVEDIRRISTSRGERSLLTFIASRRSRKADARRVCQQYHRNLEEHGLIAAAGAGAHERPCESTQIYFLRPRTQPINARTPTLDAHALSFRTAGSPTSDVGPAARAVKNASASRAPVPAERSVTLSASPTLSSHTSLDSSRTTWGSVEKSGGRTSAWETPPKKSVTSASLTLRWKRSERTPGCE